MAAGGLGAAGLNWKSCDVIQNLRPGRREPAGQAPREAGSAHQQRPLEEHVLTRLYPHVSEPFTHLLFCYRLAANKPDPVFYHQVAALLAAPPALISFADDSTDNVDAAGAVPDASGTGQAVVERYRVSCLSGLRKRRGK